MSIDPTRRQFLKTGSAFSLGAAATSHSSDLRSFYIAQLQDNGIVGSSFLLIRRSAPSAKYLYGYSDRAAKIQVDENTCYHWASITKTFTAIAIMQLRDQGLLRLDDPVWRYVPEIRDVHDPFGSPGRITIRQLITHSAGFRSPTWPWRTAEWQPFEPTKWSQIVAMLPYTAVEFPPGSRHSYSNLGIVFLGQIIERLTDDDYETYIAKNILMPLGMEHSYFDQSPPHLLADRSHSYFLADGKLTEAPFNFDTGITVSNGGLNAPFKDMEKYLRFLLGSAGEKRSEAILKRSTLDEMFEKQLDVVSSDSSQLSTAGGVDSIGIGFFRREQNGRLFVGHGGNQNGFLSHFYLHPSSGSAYLVAYNTEATGRDKSTSAVDLAIRDYAFEHLLGA